MEYEQFLETISKMVKEKLDDSYQIQINTVLKNNSVELDGLVILKRGKNISPSIYLNEFFCKFNKGYDLSDIVDEILRIYFNSNEDTYNKNELIEPNLEKWKDYIFFRLISYERNIKLLKTIPNIKFLDLAITFHCLMRDDESGIGSIRITNHYIEEWGVTTADLFQLAKKNTPLLFPTRIRSMHEVMLEMIKRDNSLLPDDNSSKRIGNDMNKTDDYKTDICDDLIEEFEKENKTKMYVLTNNKGINGASALLYENVLKEFADSINSNLYILPSSIHEVILVPCQKNLIYQELINMVNDVNNTQVLPEEVLSDNVYCYNRYENKIQ